MGRELATKIRPILQSGKIPDIVDDDLQIMFAGLMKEGLLRDLTSDFSTPAADGSDEPTTIRRRVGNPEWQWRVELPEQLDELRSRAGFPEFGDCGGWRICARRRAGRACGLSRASFRGRDIITDVFAAGMGVPAALLIIPMYLMMSQMGLISSITGLLIVYVAISLSFTMLVLTAFFATLPVELEEAAVIDGASEWRVFRSVMLPLAQPGVLTALILNFVFLWKEFFWGLVLLQSRESRTLAVAPNGLRESLAFSADWVGMFAAVVIVMVPALVVYIVLSRRVLGAVTLGAVKQESPIANHWDRLVAVKRDQSRAFGPGVLSDAKVG